MKKVPEIILSLTFTFIFFSESYIKAQPNAALIGDNIAVFYPDHYQKKFHHPSFALTKEPERTGALPGNWRIPVQFDSISGKSIASIAVEEGTDFYGTGEVTGPLKRNGEVRILWNTDNPTYEGYSGLRLYQSHPWVLGIRKDGSAFGVLADNTWKQSIILDNNITFSSDGPAFRVIVIERDSPEKVLQELVNLTGKMPLPPLWSLGYQQCRWSYYPDSRVKEIADTFRIKQIPCDVIWMDIHYMDEYRIFTFSNKFFPHPDELNAYLHKKDFKSIWMIDPGVKYDTNYHVYLSGAKKDVWVKDSAGKDFKGDVWPGPCVFPDFTQSKTRTWWAGLYKNFMAHGVDGVWNDMNEPAVFGGPQLTMPIYNVHLGDKNIHKGTHARYHNVYGMLMVKSSREGIMKANPDKRPFVLTRSNYLGGHRYAATWTGDNKACWAHLKMSIPMVMNLGLSGQPFSGPDIGGFAGNATPELYGHWIATGAFYPFSRSHTAIGTNYQEPWKFGEKIEKVSRTAIERRYRLLPYLYTLFYEASNTGMPVMRPVFFADIKDISLRKEDQAFLMGSDLLVVPKWAVDPALPKGTWRTISLVGEDSKNDPYQPDIRIRAGAIIPLGKIIQSTNQYSTDSISLLVSLNKEGKAYGKLYTDAGDGFEYQNGEYLLQEFKAEKQGNKVVITGFDSEGKLKIEKQTIAVEVVTDKRVYKNHGTKNKPIEVILK
jgi:alpha-glucosidase